MEDFQTFLRKAELDDIWTALKNKRNVWIVGESGSGKTTILERIQRTSSAELKSNITVRLVDLGKLKNANELRLFISKELGVDLGQNDLYNQKIIIRDKVLLLDNIDVIVGKDILFSQEFGGYLSTLIAMNGIQLVITSRKAPEFYSTLPFEISNWFQVIQLGAITSDVARRYLQRIADRKQLKLGENRTQQIIELAKGSISELNNIITLLIKNNMNWDTFIIEYNTKNQKSIKPTSITEEISEAQSINSSSSELPPPLIPQETEEKAKTFSCPKDAFINHATSDKPLDEIEKDKLDFSTYVNALHDFICSKYTSTPITISVDGPWGAGKTSLMCMLKNKLEPSLPFWASLIDRVKADWEWLKWFLTYLRVAPVQLCGKIFIKLALKCEQETFSYRFFKNNPAFQSKVMDIKKGIESDPAIFAQITTTLSVRARRWAERRFKCEPMDPKSHYTIWLNAWKFDKQEEVWASLALSTLEQIKKKHNKLWLLWFWLCLTFRRFSVCRFLISISLRLIIPIILGIIAFQFGDELSELRLKFEVLKDVPNYTGNILLWVIAAIGTLTSLKDIFKDPFQLPTIKVFDKPNYRERVGFLTEFEKDFARIIDLARSNCQRAL